ncbi:MAG: hypothetical protein AAF363_21095 [Bacteroidota bacterium]
MVGKIAFKKTLHLSITLVILISCNETEIDFIETSTSVKSISKPDTTALNESVRINLIIFGSNGCANFSRFEVLQLNDTSSFKLFQKSNRNEICTRAIIEIDTVINLVLSRPGINYLKFEGEQGPLVDSVFVTD